MSADKKEQKSLPGKNSKDGKHDENVPFGSFMLEMMDLVASYPCEWMTHALGMMWFIHRFFLCS